MPHGSADANLDYYNQRWYEFTGFPTGQEGDQSWEPVLHPEDVQHCHQSWYHAVNAGEPYTVEYRFLDRRTGGYCWFLGRALPIRDAEGKILRWFGTCTDIDHQKRTESALRLTNNELEQFTWAASHDLQEPLRQVNIYTQLLLRDNAAEFSKNASE